MMSSGFLTVSRALLPCAEQRDSSISAATDGVGSLVIVVVACLCRSRTALQDVVCSWLVRVWISFVWLTIPKLLCPAFKVG